MPNKHKVKAANQQPGTNTMTMHLNKEWRLGKTESRMAPPELLRFSEYLNREVPKLNLGG